MSASPRGRLTVFFRCPQCARTTKTVLFNVDPQAVKMTCIHCGHTFWDTANTSKAEPGAPRRRGLRAWWQSLTSNHLNTISIGLLSVALLLHLILELFTQ